MTPLTTKAAEMAGLVAELLRLADCDSRAGEPLGKCMREAADLIEQQAPELAERHERYSLDADELLAVAGAIGSVRFMDQPDGGDVSLAEQVKRMREALTTAESERDSWRRVCERLETEKQAALAERDELLREKERLTEERDGNRAHWLKAEAEAYELKYAAAGGEDAPGSAHTVTVADVDRWRRENSATISSQSERIAVLEAALREKDEALKPFADQSKHFDEGAVRMGFAPSFDEYRPAVSFTHGELRAARRAYDALPAALTPLGEE